MAVLPILRWPDQRLATVCAPAVLGDDLNRLAAGMLDTMYAAPGRGLAGPQVGALLRVFVMDVGWKDGNPTPEVVVNPEILWRSPELAEGPEGCLSIPGVTTRITRATSITLRWTMLDGTRREETLTGFAAICAQHEYDHLDGIVTFDRLSPEARALAEAEFAG
jgi:peptide deformylase